MSDFLEPARTVIAKLGGGDVHEGIKVAAEAAHVHPTRVYRWMKSEASGGTGGRIPGKRHELILAWARKKGIALKPDDFFLRGGRVRPTQRADEARTLRRVA
jgi:hypothetical protein